VIGCLWACPLRHACTTADVIEASLPKFPSRPSRTVQGRQGNHVRGVRKERGRSPPCGHITRHGDWAFDSRRRKSRARPRRPSPGCCGRGFVPRPVLHGRIHTGAFSNEWGRATLGGHGQTPFRSVRRRSCQRVCRLGTRTYSFVFPLHWCEDQPPSDDELHDALFKQNGTAR